VAIAIKHELIRLQREADALARQAGSRRVTKLPDLETFLKLPRSQQIETLIAYRPLRVPGPPPPDLDVFETLPVEEMKRQMDEHLEQFSRDEIALNCFRCLDSVGRYQVFRARLRRPGITTTF
jgi:hypothetical protein